MEEIWRGKAPACPGTRRAERWVKRSDVWVGWVLFGLGLGGNQEALGASQGDILTVGLTEPNAAFLDP